MAQANLQAANANIQKAKVEVDRLIPLVSSKVVSDVQLKLQKPIMQLPLQQQSRQKPL